MKWNLTLLCVMGRIVVVDNIENNNIKNNNDVKESEKSQHTPLNIYEEILKITAINDLQNDYSNYSNNKYNRSKRYILSKREAQWFNE